MGQLRHACELPIFDFSCMPLPHCPGRFVFSCHEIRSDTGLSLLMRPRQPDFTSRPICGDSQVLFLVTCGAFCCLKPEELKGWHLSQMCHWQTRNLSSWMEMSGVHSCVLDPGSLDCNDRSPLGLPVVLSEAAEYAIANRRLGSREIPVGEANVVLIWSPPEPSQPGLQKWKADWHLEGKMWNSIIGQQLVFSLVKDKGPLFCCLLCCC